MNKKYYDMAERMLNDVWLEHHGENEAIGDRLYDILELMEKARISNHKWWEIFKCKKCLKIY